MLALPRLMRLRDLDFLLDDKANTIGMLLLHIASVEFEFHKIIVEKRELTEVELDCWRPAVELGDLGREKIKGNPLEFYIEHLAEVRKKTLEDFLKLKDTWLYEESDFWDDKKENNYKVKYANSQRQDNQKKETFIYQQ